MVKAGRRGRARTAALKKIIEIVAERQQSFVGEGKPISIAWVKAHTGIEGNEEADRLAKAATAERQVNNLTEGGIKGVWQQMSRNERRVEGYEKGRVIGLNRDSVTAYSHLRTGKGRLGAWREKIGKAEVGLCECGFTETGNHFAFGCIQGEQWGRKMEHLETDRSGMAMEENDRRRG